MQHDEVSYRENLKHFEGPSIENDAWFARLNSKDQDQMSQFVNRANAAYAEAKLRGLPADYRDTIDWYLDHKTQWERENAGPVNLESIYSLDTTIAEVIWHTDTFAKLPMNTQTSPKPRWQMKKYLIASENWPSFTRKFNNPAFIQMNDTNGMFEGIGIYLGFSMSWSDVRMSNGALWSPQAFMMQELATKMGIYKSRRGFLGYGCYGAQNDDSGAGAGFTNITGLFNDANVQTYAVSGNTINAQGQAETAILGMLAKLKLCYWPGNIVVVSTSGVASQLFLNRDNYQQLLDTTRVKQYFGSGDGQISNWFVSDQLYAAAIGSATVAQQQILMYKNCAPIVHEIIFPTQVLPMADKLYESDLKEVMVFADALKIGPVNTTYNAYPIVVNSANLTTSTTGFIAEGTDIVPMILGWNERRGVQG